MLPRPPTPDPVTPTESLLAELNINSMLSGGGKRTRGPSTRGAFGGDSGIGADFEWDSDFNTETTEKCSLLAADHSMMRSMAESEESADR